MASFRMLGRLLAVGAGGGALVGGTFAVVVLVLAGARVVDWLGALSIGVQVGLVAGVVVQALTHVAVLVAGWVGLPVWVTHVVAAVVPVVAAGGVAWWVATAIALSVAEAGVAVVVVLVVSAVVVTVTVGWALRPRAGAAPSAAPAPH